MSENRRIRPLKRAAAFAGTVMSGVMLIGAASLGVKSERLKPGEVDRVASIVDGDTLFLDDGLKVRLSAIQAPKLPLGRAGFKAWPFAQEAKNALFNLTHNKTVELRYGGKERDRYDRALAQVFLPGQDGAPDLWVQEEMVRLGFARVYTWPDTWQDANALFAAERDARADKRGIWGHSYYAIRSPEPNALAQDVDSFQIVEGIITSSADIRGLTYLNFGADYRTDYRTDFTVAVARTHRKRFKKSGIDLMSLEGARVRVRGWIELTNGPIIWLDHPERLEVLD